MEIAVALISAYGQYEAGQTQQKIYNAKAQQEQQQAAFNAQQAEMQGRSEAIRARNEGLKTLANINRTISTVRARAGMYQAIGTAGGGIASYQKKGGGQAPVTDRSTKIG